MNYKFAALLSGSLLLICLQLPRVARSECIPLPSVELRSFDQDTDTDPIRVLRQVSNRLAGKENPAPSPYETVQLDAIIADASILASRPQAALQATSDAFDALSALPLNADTLRLKQRLLIAASTAFAESSNSLRAVAILDRLIVGMPQNSLERSCALEARAEARSDLNQADRAAVDALAAYRVAQAGGWANAQMQAAYVLAEIFGRAGLTDQALTMIDEVDTLASRAHRPQLLAMSAYSRGLILLDARRFADALTAFAVTESTSRLLGDSIGVASAEGAACKTLVEQGSIDEADARCTVDLDVQFNRAHRTDLLAASRDARARLAVIHGRPLEGLALLNSVLSQSTVDSIPNLLPTLYKDRAQALYASGRIKDAFNDLSRAFALDRSTTAEKRVQAVAVLAATADIDKVLVHNQLLTSRLELQRAELANQQDARRMRDKLIVAVTLLCVVLSLLVLLTSRHAKTLRKHKAIWTTYANHTPDAIVLLDGNGIVRFSNRHLMFEFGNSHPTGLPLRDSLPTNVRPVIDRAMEEIFEKKTSVNCVVALAHAGETTRYVELHGAPVMSDGQIQGATLSSFDATNIRQLEREVVDAMSSTRQRLSGEIHEGLGQLLTGALLLLRSTMTDIQRGRAIAIERLTEIHGHISSALSSSREIARGLSPIEIERGSLPDALQRLVSESARRFGIDIHFECNDSLLPIANSVAEHLYRISAEAIMNAARHSRCEAVNVSLQIALECVILSIEDDGTGIVMSDSKNEGLGLKLMAYHARLLGSSLEIRKAQPRGTSVRLIVLTGAKPSDVHAPDQAPSVEFALSTTRDALQP